MFPDAKAAQAEGGEGSGGRAGGEGGEVAGEDGLVGGACFGVHTLDDHRAVHGVLAAGLGQVARNHH